MSVFRMLPNLSVILAIAVAAVVYTAEPGWTGERHSPGQGGLSGAGVESPLLAGQDPDRPPGTETRRLPPQDEDREWIRLFDGQSLEGWRASENRDSFKVEDGKIIVDGPRSHLFYTGPVGDADFKNFELRMDVMTFPRANSGVFFHTRYQETGWPQYGYEAQINATHGDRIKTGSVYGVKNVMDEAPHQDNEWFNYHIIVDGKNVTIKVDGETVNEYTEPEEVRGTRRLSRGTIALQAHDPRSVIHFRNIDIKLLPD